MRIAKWTLMIFGGIVLLVIATAFVLASVLDANRYRGKIEGIVADLAGRPFVIEGPIAITWYPWLGLRTGAAHLANVSGVPGPPIVEWQSIAVAAKVWPLLHGEIVADRIRLQSPIIRLRRDAQGRRNWDGLGGQRAEVALPGLPASTSTGVAATTAPPQTHNAAGSTRTRSSRPLQIAGLEIRNGTVDYLDETSGLQATASNLELDVGEWRAGQPLPVHTRFLAHTTSLPPDGVWVQVDAPSLVIRLTPINVTAPKLTVKVANAQLDGDLTFEQTIGGLRYDLTRASGQTPSAPASASGQGPSAPASRSGQTPSAPASVSGQTPIAPASVSRQTPIAPASASGQHPSAPASSRVPSAGALAANSHPAAPDTRATTAGAHASMAGASAPAADRHAAAADTDAPAAGARAPAIAMRAGAANTPAAAANTPATAANTLATAASTLAHGTFTLRTPSLRQLATDVALNQTLPHDPTTLGPLELTTTWRYDNGSIAAKPLALKLDGVTLTGWLQRTASPEALWAFELHGDQIDLGRYVNTDTANKKPFELPSGALRAINANGHLIFDRVVLADTHLANVRLELQTPQGSP